MRHLADGAAARPPGNTILATNEDHEILRDFLLETTEGLGEIERQLVVLEEEPRSEDCLGSIFRAIHTIKGSAGFLGFLQIETLAHAGEHLLSRLRAGDFLLNFEMTSALLSMVDAMRVILTDLEQNPQEHAANYGELADHLAKLANQDHEESVSEHAPPSDLSAAHPPSDPPPVVPSSDEATESIPTPEPTPETPVSALLEASQPTSARGPTASDSAIRVDVDLLDRVMNLVGELVLARNQILQFSTSIEDSSFASASQRLNLLTTELQESVMKTRMQQIGHVWNKLPRVVRDLARQCNKKISLDLDGSETELDRTIVEAIRDPLTHAVRNAVDHGIESPAERRLAGKSENGRVQLRAFHEGGQVNIEVIDDGRGMDIDKIRELAVSRGVVSADHAARFTQREALQLVFRPGFSTAASVTNISGRGVGMDVVKTSVEKIGGTVDLQTTVGQGTALRIKIPLTLAIIPALVVETAASRFAIPQVSLIELVRLEGEAARRSIEELHGTPVYRLRGALLPLVFLDQALELRSHEPDTDVEDLDDLVVNIVVLQSDDRQFGLVVDAILDTEEIVVKPLGKELKSVPGFAGATIMGDGRVALILDVPGLAQRAGVTHARREVAVDENTASNKRADDDQESLLLFRLGEEGRMAIPISTVSRLEEISPDDVEHAGGRDVVQYRGAILPLLDVRRALDIPPRPPSPDPLQVIVYSERGRSVGLIVDRILDAVDGAVPMHQRSQRPGILATTVVQGHVTDVLDVHGVVRRAEPEFFEAV